MAKSTPRSFRLDADLLERLEQRARERGQSVNGLVGRYLEEAVRLEDHPLIVFREGADGRRPAIAGTRLDVAHVIDTFRASANDIAETAAYFEVPDRLVRAAVAYYAAYQTEVDEWRARRREIADREEEAWRREQALSG